MTLMQLLGKANDLISFHIKNSIFHNLYIFYIFFIDFFLSDFLCFVSKCTFGNKLLQCHHKAI